MKKTALLILSGIMAVSMSYAQLKTTPDYRKRPALGIHVNLHDFKNAAYIRENSLSDLIKDDAFSKVKDMDFGMALSYWQGITNRLDFAANLSGSFLKYPFRNMPASTSDKLLMALDATANFKMVPDNYVVSPYLTAGAGVSSYKGYWGTYIPLGTGIQVNIMDEAFIQLQAQYRLGISDNTNYHFYWGLGILGNIGKPKPKPVPQPIAIPVITDRDGDGVPDAEDECPDVAGPKALRGCPDRDGDGIPDKDDKCPDQKGTLRYNGCPPPDRDHDGIYDEDDKCPDTPGPAIYRGCPPPDTDGDGVNDEIDRCLTVPGPASNGGCPLIDQVVVQKVQAAAKEIFFASSSARFVYKSFASMDEVAKILKANSELKLDIEGHTDNTGAVALNQKLSQSRADAVKKYLIGKGIEASRLTSQGYGSDQPIADNNTPKGKAANRRVEMKLRQ